MIKKNRTTLFVMLLTMAVILSSFAAVGTGYGSVAKQEETPDAGQEQASQQGGTDIGSGNQGAFIPSAIDTSNLHAHNVHRNVVGWVNGEVIRRAVHLEAHDENGNVIGNPNIRTYVFFKLNNRDIRDWDNGNLSIMWRPTDSRTWQTCNSFAVDVQGSQQAGQQETTTEQTSQPRLACLTSQYNAYYALVRSVNR